MDPGSGQRQVEGGCMRSRVWVPPARTLLLSTVAMLLATGTSHSQSLSGDAVGKALRKGGYIIMMRHATSPREVPDRQTANKDNLKPERQLDPAGRASAAAMGKA